MKTILYWIQKQIRTLFGYGKNISIFTGDYVDIKTWYKQQYNDIPCISYIDDIDANRAFDLIDAGAFGKVLSVYQRNWYDWEKGKQLFAKTIFRLSNGTVVQLGYGNAEILYDRRNFDVCDRLINELRTLRSPVKEVEHEMNIITVNAGSLDLKALTIKPQPLDISLYYNDDFQMVNDIIKNRLNKENDKGIILLHGLPGTGKTTYLRHLIGSIKKRVLFVSPGVAANLMNPEFMDLLIDNPNSVLVIEDAENIIMDRKYNSDSSVSNLLNISDGLLSDCLNVQIICTFNSPLTMVDSALLRKGRLIAKYEFGKLGAEKAQRLSEHLGFKHQITQPITIAEITCAHEKETKAERVEVIGFRRQETLMN
jgi:hypothetical protein